MRDHSDKPITRYMVANEILVSLNKFLTNPEYKRKDFINITQKAFDTNFNWRNDIVIPSIKDKDDSTNELSDTELSDTDF